MLKIPLDEITKLLDWAMDVAVQNGANSISMPDELVAIAHFVCFPANYLQPTSPIDLPPLPEPNGYDGCGDTLEEMATYNAKQMQEYALACVTHNREKQYV